MTILEAYKREEALDLKERGLLMRFTVPLSKHDPALTTWKKHLESIGAPYLVEQNGSGCVIHKERKDFRCKHCGAFLNARPEKYRAHLTHNMVGRECAK
jgi:hypothetical protein